MKIKTRKGENNQCLRKTQIRLAEKPRLTVTVRRPQPKISVIIPCYNVEKYIKQCLDSVLSQTLTDIEIICVNDGSADGTLPILKAYETLNERVFIIDKPNGGYGAAMNAGMAAANGKYVGIVESDDFIDPQMFETLYNLSQNGTVDVVKGNFYDYYAPANKVPRADINHERDRVIVLDRPFHITENTEMLWGHPSVWSGIYRRAFLVEHNVSFIEAKSGGWVDNPFFFETMLKAKSIVWVPAPLYYYRKTNESSSSNKQSNAILPFVRMMDNLSVLENSEYGNETDILRVTYARALMYLRGALFECDYENNFNAINEYAAKLFSNIREAVILQHYNLNDQHTFLEYLSPLKSIQAKFPRILIYNWLPFDNMWNWGGGVTVYCKSLIDTILTENPFTQIYFLSSGFAYKSTTTETFIRKIPNIFGDKVHQFEIVNSPVPAEQRYMFVNPLAALNNETLKDAVRQFMTAHGIFSAVHFNNIEGLSIDVLDLKKEFPQTEFIFSIHNY
ncbi:MAG: glycosyltransferase, partial [Clostridiales bacterium]|nr:glycosyltransferase [Clostridiales bacterium]